MSTTTSGSALQAGPWVFAWVDEYPSEEDARAELEERISEAYPTGTPTQWEWVIRANRHGNNDHQSSSWTSNSTPARWTSKPSGRRPVPDPRHEGPHLDRSPPAGRPVTALLSFTKPANGPPSSPTTGGGWTREGVLI